MNEDKERVSYIRYSFSVEDIIQAITPSTHKAEESVDKYARLCEEALHRTYPNAEIDIVRVDADGALPASSETVVYVSYNFQDIEDNEAATAVELICEQIFEQFDSWLIPKHSVPIAESRKYSNLPPSVVRFLCERGRIVGAERNVGFWRAPLEVMQCFHEEEDGNLFHKIIYGEERLNVNFAFWENLNLMRFENLAEQAEMLIVANNGFGLEILSSHTSYLRLSRRGSKVRINVKQFVDVDSWSDPLWAYDAYAKELVEQAKRIGIECEHNAINDSESDRIYDVVFRFEETVPQTASVQEVVHAKLETIAEIVKATKLSLAGGPVWDERYEKDEDLFCREVLKQLLHQMGFQRIRYTHGNRHEHGRDFIFAYQTPFHQPVYFGLQAKRGKVTGRANSKIKEILEQVERAFTVPYEYEPGSAKTAVHISCMIVAISGEFTDDALATIQASIPRYQFPIGAVYFWDKSIIRSLISDHWGRSNA